MKPKLIIVEGPQGVGKTTMTNWLRDNIPTSNLYRMSGIKDKTIDGRRKCVDMYNALIEYLDAMGRSECNMHLIFDRIFITERVYCILGFKEYDFAQEFERLYHKFSDLSKYYDIIIINLYVSTTEIYKSRLVRDKATYEHAKFDIRSSIRQQDVYYDVIYSIHNMYHIYSYPKMITIDTSGGQRRWEEDLRTYLGDVIKGGNLMAK